MKTKIFLLIPLVFILTAGQGFASAEETLPVHIKMSIKQQKLEDVEREADKLTQAGNSFLASLARGEMHLLKGELEKAEDSFRKALEMNPAGIEGKIGVAKVLAAKKETAKARQQLLDALRTSPHPVRLYYELGLILEASGDTKGAAEAFEKALERHFTKK
jgi:tetratricopeptide (TPR) repeat protein